MPNKSKVEKKAKEIKKGGKNWIKGAIKNPGALTKKAKAAGQLTKSGDIKDSWIDKAATNKGDKFSKKTEKQAELAKTLKKMRKKKK